MQDGAAVTGLAVAAASLVAVNRTGNAIYDPIGSIVVGNLLGMVRDASFNKKLCRNCNRIPHCCLKNEVNICNTMLILKLSDYQMLGIQKKRKEKET